MPSRTSKAGSELFIVDNSDEDWKVLRYLHDWCQLSRAIDIASGYFEISALLSLKEEWQKVDAIRILMGDEVSKRTKAAFAQGLRQVARRHGRQAVRAAAAARQGRGCAATGSCPRGSASRRRT